MTATWILFTLVVGFLVAAGAWALEGVCRVARLPVRWVWAGSLALTVVLVALAPFRTISIAAPTIDVGVIGGGGVESAWSALPGKLEVISRRTFIECVPVIWLALSGSLLALYVVVHARLRRLQRDWPQVDILGIRVSLSPNTGPVTVGLNRPSIVVPQWLLGYSLDRQRLVLAHEQEHVRARDPLLLAAGCAAVVLLPWHPAAWWMLSRLRLGVELDCDARVLQRGVARRDYGELLVDVAGRTPGLPAAVLAMAANSTHLQQRLIAMQSIRLRFPRVRGSALAAFAAVALVAACAARVPVVATVPEAALAAPATLADPVVVAPATPAAPAPTRPAVPQPAPAPANPIDSLLRSDPLVILDGVRLGPTARADLEKIDRNSIASVEVLKGAAAIDVYGADASRGVVLITTKKAPTVPHPGTPMFNDRQDIERSGLGTPFPSHMSVEFQGASLSQVMRTFAEFAGSTIVVRRDVPEQSVTAVVKNQPWRRAFDDLMTAMALVVHEEPAGVIRVEPRPGMD